MSQKETTDTIDNLPKLAELARQAYEQKRTKDCLDLTRSILLIDPDNTAAHSMRSSIQSELQRDLENARAFLRQVQSKHNVEQESETSDASLLEAVSPPDAAAASTGSSRMRWLLHASLLIALLLVAVALPRFAAKSNPAEVSRPTAKASDVSKPIADLNAAPSDPLLPPVSAEVVPAATPASEPAPVPASVSITPPKDQRSTPARLPAPALPEPPALAAANGTLAVSSPTSVDIYKDDAYIGSAPVSLELPVGPNTLEYRHGSLRRKLTHVISSNETTRAMVTFDVSVQINSKPWAEVFVDGVERKALGQTPLSGIRVPIGSVLIFENPQFQSKKYRVNGNETGIQIVFP